MTVCINYIVAIIEEKLLRILAEFGAKGIMKIPKETLCRLTGYTSTSTKTWSTAFKNSRKNLRVETRNGETTVEIKKVSQKKNPKMRPKKIEMLLKKYSKELQIQKTTFDVFEVLLHLGPRDFIAHEDLAKVVNKNIATKSFISAPKLMDSFGIIEKRGRGKNSSYRLTQSMFDQDEKKTDHHTGKVSRMINLGLFLSLFVPQILFLTSSTCICSFYLYSCVIAGKRAATAEKMSDKGLSCEENAPIKDTVISLERENSTCYRKQQSQDGEETVMETDTNLVLQATKEDANINNGGRQHKAGVNIGNLSVNIQDNTGISKYPMREAEYIIEV